METKELYYPQISAQAGSYTFEEGVELEIYSSKSSYYDWARRKLLPAMPISEGLSR